MVEAQRHADDRDYATRLGADRAARDAALAASDDPIPKARHAEFLPLAYFPIDPEFNVPAELKRIVRDMGAAAGMRQFCRFGERSSHMANTTQAGNKMTQDAAKTMDKAKDAASGVVSGHNPPSRNGLRSV